MHANAPCPCSLESLLSARAGKKQSKTLHKIEHKTNTLTVTIIVNLIICSHFCCGHLGSVFLACKQVKRVFVSILSADSDEYLLTLQSNGFVAWLRSRLFYFQVQASYQHSHQNKINSHMTRHLLYAVYIITLPGKISNDI